MTRKGIIIIGLLISAAIIPFVIFSLQFYAIVIDDPEGGPEDVIPPPPLLPPSPPSIIYPSNPSIIINNGETTTNSLEVILTLSCENADEMCFQISEDIWINWTAYSTSYIITLFENDPAAPDYRIGVIFRNEEGTTEDAGYGDIYDDIIYDPEEVPPPPPPPPDKDEEIDYTLTYVLIGVLIGLVGIGIFLKYRKQIIKSK